mmetsp:Transcript_8804/g.22162  ORF Transcript_8804/g.22162 Transcript_8804/m.22162 type:complete len:239 (+) Transcript_8804:185-901(+)
MASRSALTPSLTAASLARTTLSGVRLALAPRRMNTASPSGMPTSLRSPMVRWLSVSMLSTFSSRSVWYHRSMSSPSSSVVRSSSSLRWLAALACSATLVLARVKLSSNGTNVCSSRVISLEPMPRSTSACMVSRFRCANRLLALRPSGSQSNTTLSPSSRCMHLTPAAASHSPPRSVSCTARRITFDTLCMLLTSMTRQRMPNSENFLMASCTASPSTASSTDSVVLTAARPRGAPFL